jgi:hypothetical protein
MRRMIRIDLTVLFEIVTLKGTVPVAGEAKLTVTALVVLAPVVQIPIELEISLSSWSTRCPTANRFNASPRRRAISQTTCPAAMS